MENSAVRSLYEKYGHMIFGRCLKILHDKEEAADAMQTVFLKLLEQGDTIRDPERTVAWIFSAATNHCFNQLRSRKKFDPAIDPHLLAGDDDFTSRIADREVIGLLMANLDTKTRQVVYLTHVEKLDQQDIQRVTGLSPATIRRRLRGFESHCRTLSQRLLKS
jgi:RNA polymerase sigma-70 factor (ECF subfamily)